MVCFALSEYLPLAKNLIEDTNISLGEFKVDRFPNAELYGVVKTNVRDQDCLVVGTIAPPDENLISLALLAHTLKKEGAKKIKLILPYIAYARQDKPKPNESMMTDLVGKILQVAGVDEVVTIEVHSEHVAKLFPMPLKSLSPIEIFSDEIKKIGWIDASLVAPDKSALKRCEEIINRLGMKSSLAYLDKERTLEGIKHLDFHGEVKEKAIIIDDMLDTGGTLVSCVEQLVQAGVKEIVIMVAHGIFAGEKWKKLWELNVKNIYCLDTVLPLPVVDDRVITLSSVPLLRGELHEKPRT